MVYSGYEILWLFFAYSFLGWILETVSAAVKQKRFVNRGLINAPLCVIYGIGAVIITVFFQELSGFWLFASSVIVTTVLEWAAGHLIERMYHERWWDYSGNRYNLDGYICVQASALWGALALLMMYWGNPLLVSILGFLPDFSRMFVLLALAVLLGLDTAATLIIMRGRSKRMEQWEAVDQWLTGVSSRLGREIYTRVDARIQKAYPVERVPKEPKPDPDIFAYGCGPDKLIWLFVMGAFLGDLVETVFCRFSMGRWMSRSSVVWGPFSIVWGLAIAAATLLLYRYKERSNFFLFAAGTCLGGVYEYLCSVFTELIFGKIFWDYSHIPFNLGGRVNLLFCFFWGLAAVVWMKLLYPRASCLIEKIPIKIGKLLTLVLVFFMCANMAVSCMALVRSGQRSQGIPPKSSWQKIMDERFDDGRLDKIYPNAKAPK